MGDVVVEFWPGVGLTLLTIFIPLIIICVIQFLLTRFASLKVGKIFMAVTFVLVTGIVIITMVNGLKLVKVPKGETSIGEETVDERVYTIYVIIDKGTETVEAFSDLEIKNTLTGEVTYVPLVFNDKGEFVGNEEELDYPYEIEKLEYYDNGYIGKSLTISEMKKAYVEKNGSYKDEVIILALLIYLISIAQFIVYRKTKKRVETKHYMNEIDKMKIQEL